ncbi:hypothetical protein [Streptomyces sp. NPDC002547]
MTTPRYTGPTRASLAFLAFLTLACLTSTVITAVRHEWAWAVIAYTATCFIAYELGCGIAERRSYRHRSGM